MWHDVDAWPMSSHVSATATTTNNSLSQLSKSAQIFTRSLSVQPVVVCWCCCRCVRTSALITAHYSDQSVACCQLEDNSNNVSLSPTATASCCCHCQLLQAPQTTTINVEWQQLQAATRALGRCTEVRTHCNRQPCLIHFLILLLSIL